MRKAHDVQKVSFAGRKMLLSVDGRDYEIDLAAYSRKLAQATLEQKHRFEVSPSGYGIHWPELDEDLSIDGLIGIRHSPPAAKVGR